MCIRWPSSSPGHHSRDCDCWSVQSSPFECARPSACCLPSWAQGLQVQLNTLQATVNVLQVLSTIWTLASLLCKPNNQFCWLTAKRVLKAPFTTPLLLQCGFTLQLWIPPPGMSYWPLHVSTTRFDAVCKKKELDCLYSHKNVVVTDCTLFNSL
jgi:hypothetical protein